MADTFGLKSIILFYVIFLSVFFYIYGQIYMSYIYGLFALKNDCVI